MEILFFIILYTYIFVIGLFLGSFFNVVGIRIPNKESILGRSHCPSCNRTLGVLELFPIIGYLVLKGKCKECGTKISMKYPLMEMPASITRNKLSLIKLILCVLCIDLSIFGEPDSMPIKSSEHPVSFN